eukprot:1948626-Pleurochrysis_carterae.AAC.1
MALEFVWSGIRKRPCAETLQAPKNARFRSADVLRRRSAGLGSGRRRRSGGRSRRHARTAGRAATTGRSGARPPARCFVHRVCASIAQLKPFETSSVANAATAPPLLFAHVTPQISAQPEGSTTKSAPLPSRLKLA